MVAEPTGGPRAELVRAETCASAVLDDVERRALGPVRAADVVAFSRACGETDPRLLDPSRPDFVPHPMYIPSVFRGPAGADEHEFRADGMYVDEVPGTDGLDVVLMAGGQDNTWFSRLPLDEPIELTRWLVSVTRKGRGDTMFLLLTIRKVYSAAGNRIAEVDERFLVR